MKEYHKIGKLIEMIDEPNRSACQKLYDDTQLRFPDAPGSSVNHQAWTGGYWDHITEVMNYGVLIYKALQNTGRKLKFSISDTLLVLLLHDLEKPWKHVPPFCRLGNDTKLDTKEDRHKFRLCKIAEYGIKLTPELENAIKYAEGEGDDYTNTGRVMNELAGLVHICDIASARIYHDYPLAQDDPWTGASRSR